MNKGGRSGKRDPARLPVSNVSPNIGGQDMPCLHEAALFGDT